ncbi:MAG: BrnT family toxin [Nitrospira sp.]|nr:BrnT family toxin [Nitrospira sp.]
MRNGSSRRAPEILKCIPYLRGCILVYIRLGRSLSGRILFVVYTIRRRNHEKETIRIISARQASRKERHAYAGRADSFLRHSGGHGRRSKAYASGRQAG